MEILVYDSQFELKKVVENYNSLLWKRCYYDVGTFNISCPITQDNVEALQLGRIVWIRGKKEAGVIESRTMQQSATQNTMTVSGRFLESYMDRRVIQPTVNFSGRVEDAMRQLLSSLPMITLGEIHDWDDQVSFQATYKNLLDYEKKLARYAAYGFRFVPDFSDKTITFEVYRGENHSIEQSDLPMVIFSEEYANMLSSDYTENDQLYKTVVYVGGEGDWRDKEIVVVGDDTATGLNRREVFCDASDLTSNGLTMNQYRDALRQRGIETLNKSMLSKSFTCQTNPNANFVYGKNYDVGDIVTIQKSSWGLAENKRITEVTEIYEHGTPRIEPVFGDPLPETVNWEG